MQSSNFRRFIPAVTNWQISLLQHTGQVAVMLIKLTTNTHSCSWLLQLHYGPPFWLRMKSTGLHCKNSKKINKSNPNYNLIQAYKANLQRKVQVQCWHSKTKWKWSLLIHCGKNAVVDETLRQHGKQSSLTADLCPLVRPQITDVTWENSSWTLPLVY